MNFGDWQLFRATVSQMATSCEAAGYVGSHHSKPPPPLIHRFSTCDTSRINCSKRKLPVSKAAL